MCQLCTPYFFFLLPLAFLLHLAFSVGVCVCLRVLGCRLRAEHSFRCSFQFCSPWVFDDVVVVVVVG